MAQFPGKESEILVLAQTMVTGLGDNPSVFPNLPISVGDFNTLLTTVVTRIAAVTAAEAALAAAYQQKTDAFGALTPAMKQLLAYAEVITNHDNAKLELIGWGARKPEVPVTPPGQVQDLEAKVQGEGSILLSWGKPVAGGAVLIYEVHRRERPAGAWELIKNSHTIEITLSNQPRLKELEYRIIANNKAGDGPPSNTVMAVL